MAGQYKTLAKFTANILFYDRIKHYFMPGGLSNYEGLDLFWRWITAATLGGVVTLMMSYPFEVIQTRL